MRPVQQGEPAARDAVTIEDIGRELGISAMTVSRALNGHPHVKQATRERVLSAAARLNYRPNRWARSLATQKSQLIGMVIPDISHSFFAEITRAVQERIEPLGYALMLCHSNGDPARERTAIERLLGSRVDGLLVASSRPAGDPGIFFELKQSGTPFVLIDRYFHGFECPGVRTDDLAVGRLATEHLIELGHTRIAHIRGPEVSTAQLRSEGFLQAMAARDLDVQDYVTAGGGFEFDSGHAAMQQLLARAHPPTAVFAVNDPSAFGAVQACREAGLEVPGDISIAGAGSIEGRYHPNPFLTSVDWSRAELGEHAARMLIEAIGGGVTGAAEWVSQPRLIVRQSTGSPRQAEASTPVRASSGTLRTRWNG